MCAPGRFRIPAVRPIRIDCPSTCRTCKKSETGNRVSGVPAGTPEDRKSTRLNSSHSQISYAVFCLKKKTHHHLGDALGLRAVSCRVGIGSESDQWQAASLFYDDDDLLRRPGLELEVRKQTPDLRQQ